MTDADQLLKARLRLGGPLSVARLPPCRFVYTIATYVSRAAKFDWDEANTRHVALHGVTPEEVEHAFANDPLVVLAVQKRNAADR